MQYAYPPTLFIIIYKIYILHPAQVQIEGDFLPCSFSLLEDQPMDMLLGLDMLKRHQVCLGTLVHSQ